MPRGAGLGPLRLRPGRNRRDARSHHARDGDDQGGQQQVQRQPELHSARIRWASAVRPASRLAIANTAKANKNLIPNAAHTTVAHRPKILARSSRIVEPAEQQNGDRRHHDLRPAPPHRRLKCLAGLGRKDAAAGSTPTGQRSFLRRRRRATMCSHRDTKANHVRRPASDSLRRADSTWI